MVPIRDEVGTARRLMASLRRGEIDRREFLILASGLSAATILAACNPTSTVSPPPTGAPASGAAPTPAPSTGGGSGRKTVPLYTTENDPSTLAFYASVISTFQGEFPEVDVPITLYQDENQLQYLTTALQTGTDIGVFGPPPSFIADWARQGFLLPLTGLVQQVGEADFLDGTRVVVDGEDYAIPFQANASAVYYRKDLLEAAGIAAPTTYDEYLGAVTALNKDGIVGIASSVNPSPQLSLQFFTPYIHQAGWDYFNKDGDLRFDQPEVLDAVKRYVAIMANTTENFYNAGFGDIQTAYIGGQAAFATFPGRLGVNLERQAPAIADVTGVMGIPAGPFMTGQLHFGGTQHYSISSKTAFPDEAAAFLEALTTGDNALAFALTVPGHLLPPLESVRAKLRAAEDPYIAKHQDWMTTFLDLVPGAMSPSLSMGSVDAKAFTKKLSNVCPWGSEVWTSPPFDGNMLQEILINKKDPEAAWMEAAKGMGDVAAKWKAANPDWAPSA